MGTDRLRRLGFVVTLGAATLGGVSGSAFGMVLQEAAASDRVQIIVPQRHRWAAQSCVVTGVQAEALIVDSVATTTLKITVRNPGNQRAEAQVVLPVASGAAVRTFGIDGIGVEPTAELLPREEATKRYREIVSRMTDPGLLEFVGTDLIQSSVFPVEPGAERVVTVVYEHTLPAHAGRVEYVLPRSASLDASGTAWSLTMEIESTGELGPVFSPSHPVVTKPSGSRGVRVTVPRMDEPGPFRLYAVTGPSAGGATVLMYPEGDAGGYFLFVGDAPEPVETEPMPRELTLVIDRSGSMAGQKMQQAKESARQIIAGLRLGERFNIIDYSGDIRSFAPHPVVKTDDNMKEAMAYIDAIQAQGWTNLHDALVESLRSPLEDGHLGMVLFLTDGLPTQGVTGEADIRKAAREHNKASRRVFTFGVGLDVNAPLLDGVARDTRAESTFVLPNEDVEIKVGQVFDKLDGPVIVAPVFTTHAPDGTLVDQRVNPTVSFVHPDSLGDVFRGSRVMVVGQYARTGPLTLRVAGEDGPVIEGVLDPSEASARHGFVARLWAQRRIDAILSMIRSDTADGSEPNKELVDEVVRLSLAHGIMTEYTAFLAAEETSLAAASAPASEAGQVYLGIARENVRSQNAERSGAAGVSQTVNRKDVAADAMLADVAPGGGKVESLNVKSNVWYDADMKLQRAETVQRGPQGTLYRKTGRWVEAALGEAAEQDPEQTVEFGSEVYWTLVDDLTGQGRQWMLANRGELYLLNHGRRVLVKNPS
jgi:Ca-activated chloride channel family protein